MINSNPILGTALHAIGGASASACYLPFQETKQWSWETFWLVQATFAWVIMPIVVGYFTVPDFFTILIHAPSTALWSAFLLGAVYGFGGMAFGMSIQNIGYSLTYTISIGISAILGTVTPLILKGQLTEYFMRPGSWIVLFGMVLSIIGVALCGWAGFRKETDLLETKTNVKFNMKIGLALAVFAGLFSAIFNLSLEAGQPIADMAAQNGAGNFEGNAKMIVSTSGCFIVNFVWFVILGIRKKTLKEFTRKSGISPGLRTKNFLWSALAGTLWCCQFFFYGLGHVQMGNFQFISWVLHMSMLIFFSYIVGVIMKEWKSVSKPTYYTLVFALIILVMSFVIMSYGSYYGENINKL